MTISCMSTRTTANGSAWPPFSSLHPATFWGLEQTSMPQRFDLVILGSGSTAFAAALRAAELGKTAVMTESRIVGGTCANRGCLPSKNLIEASRIVYESAHPRYPGLTPAKMAIDFRVLVEQ